MQGSNGIEKKNNQRICSAWPRTKGAIYVLESQKMTKKIPEAQGLDKTTEIKAKDGPRTTIADEEGNQI